MKYTLKAYCISEFGQRKDEAGNPHQEDCVFPSVANLKDSTRTFILCDGMGGHAAGEVASSTVCETMGEIVSRCDETDDITFSEEDFSNALNAAFDALDERDNGAAKKMGTTMTFLKFHNKGATIAHIGDSRVYHIRPGKTGEETEILFVTQDHSLVNDLVRVGEITREEAKLSKQKNVITRAMQANMERRPNADIHSITDIRPGDYFYMCSDGMLEQPDMESGDTIRNIFSKKGGTAENKVQILKSVTDDNKDNHTAFIIHVEDVINQNKDAKKEEKIIDPDSEKKRRGGLIGFIVAAFAMITIIVCYNVFKSDSNKNTKYNSEADQEVIVEKVADESQNETPAIDAPKKEEVVIPTHPSKPGKTSSASGSTSSGQQTQMSGETSTVSGSGQASASSSSSSETVVSDATKQAIKTISSTEDPNTIESDESNGTGTLH